MRKWIILGILSLLFLVGAADAKMGYSRPPYPACEYCHTTGTALGDKGIYYNVTHKFDGIGVPLSTASCTSCHTNLTAFLPLTPTGLNYSSSHRYNATTLASARLAPPACGNCHTNAGGGDFSLLSGTPTYLTSTTCENCHKEKYDDWKGTMHRVMLTNRINAQAMNLPLPTNVSWDNISYVIVGKPELRYVNESGYLFKRYYANGTFAVYGPRQYTCGGCHTTGYNASGGNQSGLPGIVGTWSEPGIACEKCHGAGGNGHQVEANVSAQVCYQCHNGSTRQGAWLSSGHAPPLKASTSASCQRCHSPFDYAKNRTVTSTKAINVVCANCHNSHDTSDEQYKELFSPSGFNATKMADVKETKVSFFNSSASRTSGSDVYDDLTTPRLIYDYDSTPNSYPGPINVTGPVSEVLCSLCHYNHGLSHIGQVNLTHARKYNPNTPSKWATCTDCHMSGTKADHSFDVKSEINFPSNTCSRGTECHVTSSQNLNKSADSVVPVVNEWEESAHNNSEWGAGHNRSSCAQCHSPMNWNPLNASATIAAADYKGITCAVCHNLHDMGDWLTKTQAKFGEAKPYAWFDRDGLPRTNATGAITSYRPNYSMMETTTELCTNCHQNRPEYSAPGWTGRGPHRAIVPHGSAQKDLFVGSWKESSALSFECADCHMYTKTIDPTNLTEKVLPDSQKVTGHTFKVNAPGLGAQAACSGCHADGSLIGNVTKTIEDIKTDIEAKWNAANTTVENSWSTYNAYAGEKNLSSKKLAEAFFKLYQVKNDGSWGVHNPAKAKELISAASRLASEASATLGQKEIVSRVQLKAGWNLAALNGTTAVTSPASVMSSVANDITVVWGYNAATRTWELYDPTMPSTLNTLNSIVPGKGYWIYAIRDVEWTA